jgi:hypothetical protein
MHAFSKSSEAFTYLQQARNDHTQIFIILDDTFQRINKEEFPQTDV